MKRSVCTILLWFCLVLGVFSQFYSGGTDPASLKWNQLETDNFRLIYPRGIDSLALRYAWLLQTAGMRTIEGLDAKPPKKLPVILHPYTSRSNGFVVWAPQRMELFCLPSPGGEPQNWEISLTLHESRHVAQMQRAGEGLFSKLYWLIGEQSQGLAAGLLDFFSVGLLEGDAVMTETAYSAAGRGRQAEFLMPYKAYFMDSVHFSIDKWHFGSEKNFIPNEYALGYLKLSAGSYLNAPNALSSVFKDITRNPFLYNKSYKKHFGSDFYQLFEPSKALYTQFWQEEAAEKAPFDSLRLFSPEAKHFVSYKSPCFAAQGVLVLRESLSDPLAMVRIKPGQKAERLRYMGDVNSLLIAKGNNVYWTEQLNSPRWVHKSYSVLFRYELDTKMSYALSEQSHYYFPSLSEDGQLLAVASYLIGGGAELHVLDAFSGEVRQVYAVPRGDQLFEMDWDDQNQRIFAVLISNKGAGIYLLDVQTGEWKELIAPQHRKLSDLHYCKETLCFESDAGGTDNIFRFYLKAAKSYRMTNARFGAFDFCWNASEDSLYYISYDTRGYQLAVLPAEELSHVEQSFESVLPDRNILDQHQGLRPLSLADRFTAEVGFVADTMQVPKNLSYPLSKYNKAGNLFHIHSWAPLYYDLDELVALSYENLHRAIRPGAMLMSQNALSTSVLQAGYAYRKGFHSGHLKYTYSGWYPVWSFKADFNDRYVIRQGLSLFEGGGYIIRDTLSTPSVNTQLSVYVPFDFDKFAWNRGIIPSINWQFSNNSYFNRPAEKSHHLNTIQAGLQLYSMLNMAQRDLFPRWGVGLHLQLAAAPFNKDYFTDRYYAKLYGYLPGLFKNQGIKMSIAYQRHSTENKNFYLGNAIRLRAADDINAPEILSFSFDYALPVFLDLSLPKFLYVKRMELYPFVDILNTSEISPSGLLQKTHYSAGLETIFNFNLLRLNAEISAGLRSSYNSSKGMVYELILSLPYL